MADIVDAIRETINTAHELQTREASLRDAVASGDEAAILAAAREFFREEHVE
jgi:hypothetical protein